MSGYRWERDEDERALDAMLLRTDDNRPRFAAYTAQYWRDPVDGLWRWSTRMAWLRGGKHGACDTADAARRACELAVLHGEAPHGA